MHLSLVESSFLSSLRTLVRARCFQVRLSLNRVDSKTRERVHDRKNAFPLDMRPTNAYPTVPQKRPRTSRNFICRSGKMFCSEGNVAFTSSKGHIEVDTNHDCLSLLVSDSSDLFGRSIGGSSGVLKPTVCAACSTEPSAEEWYVAWSSCKVEKFWNATKRKYLKFSRALEIRRIGARDILHVSFALV